MVPSFSNVSFTWSTNFFASSAVGAGGPWRQEAANPKLNARIIAIRTRVRGFDVTRTSKEGIIISGERRWSSTCLTYLVERLAELRRHVDRTNVAFADPRSSASRHAALTQTR